MNNRAPLWLNISPKAVSSWKIIKKKNVREEKRAERRVAVNYFCA